MSPLARSADEAAARLPFGTAAEIFKALGHPLRLRLVCGLCREPSNLTRIVAALDAPLSTVALHLGALRRAGILVEERRGTEVVFQVGEDRVRRVLRAFCGESGEPAPADWDWKRLGESLRRNTKGRKAPAPDFPTAPRQARRTGR